jgi:hypothetical protein
MKQDTVVFILCLLSAVFALAIQSWAEPKWIAEARKTKAECEENIPRKEVCVAVFFPRSKD